MDALLCGEELRGKVTPALAAQLNLTEAIVPTRANAAQSALAARVLAAGHHFLAVGPTGSGKTAVIKSHLLRGPQPEVPAVPLLLSFSANTTAGEV